MGTVIQLPEGKLLACVSAATYIQIDERRQQSGSLLCYTIFFCDVVVVRFSDCRERRVACLFYCRRLGLFVTLLFHVVDIPLRSANYRNAFNEPKRRCNEPRRSTRPLCRRSIHITPSTWRTCKKCLTSASKWRPNDSLSSKKFSSISTKDWISVRIQREFDVFFFLFFHSQFIISQGNPTNIWGGVDLIQFNCHSSMIDRIVVSILSLNWESHLVWPRQFDTNNALAALFSICKK